MPVPLGPFLVPFGAPVTVCKFVTILFVYVLGPSCPAPTTDYEFHEDRVLNGAINKALHVARLAQSLARGTAVAADSSRHISSAHL